MMHYDLCSGFAFNLEYGYFVELLQRSCFNIRCSPVRYSLFHSSLPFEHLGQSNLFNRVCRLFVNQVTFYIYFRTETVSQVPGVLKIYSAFIFS